MYPVVVAPKSHSQLVQVSVQQSDVGTHPQSDIGCVLAGHTRTNDAPRKIINSITGLDLKEMKRIREKSFCCGGGGSQIFYEMEGERISKLRMEEALNTGAEILAVACPYCNNLFRGETADINVMDLSELLELAIKKS